MDACALARGRLQRKQHAQKPANVVPRHTREKDSRQLGKADLVLHTKPLSTCGGIQFTDG